MQLDTILYRVANVIDFPRMSRVRTRPTRDETREKLFEAAAEVFEELKKNHEEPDPFTAVKIGLDPSETPGAKMYNQAPQEFLRSVPGVTGKNIHNLMVEWENIQAISQAPEGRLMEVVGPEAGRQIWGFFNKKLH